LNATQKGKMHRTAKKKRKIEFFIKGRGPPLPYLFRLPVDKNKQMSLFSENHEIQDDKHGNESTYEQERRESIHRHGEQ
jgi:hypothetical protein